MKNLLLFLFLSTSIAFAQVEKPTEGMMFQVTFMPNLEGGPQFGLGKDAEIVFRRFVYERDNPAITVIRWKSAIAFEDNKYSNFSAKFMYGIETHHKGSARLATYRGWEAGAAYSSLYDKEEYDPSGEWESQNSFAVAAAYFVGANYYFAQNLYLGLELNYTLVLGQDGVSISPGVNGMFTLGFKL